jgi:hypothetical protein
MRDLPLRGSFDSEGRPMVALSFGLDRCSIDVCVDTGFNDVLCMRSDTAQSAGFKRSSNLAIPVRVGNGSVVYFEEHQGCVFLVNHFVGILALVPRPVMCDACESENLGIRCNDCGAGETLNSHSGRDEDRAGSRAGALIGTRFLRGMNLTVVFPSSGTDKGVVEINPGFAVSPWECEWAVPLEVD